MEAYKKAGNRKDAPPAHEMVHFAGLLSEKRSFGDFRTVLHTGLFSQIVAMEIPVNGEIGDEVRLHYPQNTPPNLFLFPCHVKITNFLIKGPSRRPDPTLHIRPRPRDCERKGPGGQGW
jgi:hypothetical protein